MNFVVIVTDDQSSDMLPVMSAVQSGLIAPGVRFDNAIVGAPVCGPNRCTILSGQYPHTHGIQENSDAWPSFPDADTLATRLQAAGHQTCLAGKYLNGYEDSELYVPPAWSTWRGLRGVDYYDYDIIRRDGSGPITVEHRGAAETDYSVDVISQMGDTFIRSATAPWFLYLAPNAPHPPFEPAARHIGTLAGYPPWRPPSYNEADVSDKPKWVGKQKVWGKKPIANHDQERIDKLETLLSVDELVGRLLSTLEELGQLDDTLILYTSDNGFCHGEHRVWGKGVPYHTATEIPFIVRWDGHVNPGTRLGPVSSTDIAPTLAAIAGTSVLQPDGIDISPRFLSDDLTRLVHFERKETGDVPAFCGTRSVDKMYTHYGSHNEEEFYDLAADPDELVNKASAGGATFTALKAATQAWCQPEPDGMPGW